VSKLILSCQRNRKIKVNLVDELKIPDRSGFEFIISERETSIGSFPVGRLLNWNFVSSRKERLEQAKDDWIHRRFPGVPGETEFVPYPVIG